MGIRIGTSGSGGCEGDLIEEVEDGVSVRRDRLGVGGHDVLVADETGAELLAGTYAHDEKGLSALCRLLVRLEVVLVAVERPDGLLVERLLDAGLRVLALHPNKGRGGAGSVSRLGREVRSV